MDLFLTLVRSGIDSLTYYLGYHVITCFILAFLLAGAIVTFVRRETIIAYIGSAANKLQPLAPQPEVVSL